MFGVAKMNPGFSFSIIRFATAANHVHRAVICACVLIGNSTRNYAEIFAMATEEYERFLGAGQHCRGGIMPILPSKEKKYGQPVEDEVPASYLWKRVFSPITRRFQVIQWNTHITCEISNMEKSPILFAPIWKSLFLILRNVLKLGLGFIQMRESCPDVLRNEVRPFSCGRKQGVFRWLLARWIQRWLHGPI